MYRNSGGTCTEDNSNFETFGVDVMTTELDPSTGNILNLQQFNITTASRGILTPACEAIVGENEFVNGWAFFTRGAGLSIDAENLAYMCASEGEGYVPTETWTNSQDQSCTCTLQYEVSCI